MRIWAWQNLWDSHRDIFHYLGLQAEEPWAKIWHGFPCFVDCENWEEQLSNFWRTTKKWTRCSFLLLLKSCSVAPLFFQCRRTCYLCYIVKSPGASRPKHSKISFWTKKQLLPGRCCVFRVAGAAFGSEMGPLVWRFKTCSVITCCRQVVLLDAFAPWFSWHQRLTCRQAAAFPGSDLGASELVVSSRVPKCLHRIGSFGPPKRGSKSKASNQAAFIGLSCAVPARGRWIVTDGRPTQAMRQFQSTGT